MMRTAETSPRRLVLVVLALASLSACAADGPTVSDATQPRAPAPKPTLPAPTYPPLSCIGAVYDRVTASTVPGTSRYVVCLDGRFVLQYDRPAGSFGYTGRYVRTNSELTFNFDVSNTAGPWIATGIVQGDDLTVKYNEVMNWADFEDGVYRAPPSPWDY